MKKNLPGKILSETESIKISGITGFENLSVIFFKQYTGHRRDYITLEKALRSKSKSDFFFRKSEPFPISYVIRIRMKKC